MRTKKKKGGHYGRPTNIPFEIEFMKRIRDSGKLQCINAESELENSLALK
jgi:hypothetical protein